ncbi:MAG: PadR family transcriptional regulator, regulatory protein PadR [Gaiellales bacterium]|jgi:DNA-binding PadR family transcriptional regulator|nr:PadR family transcriptional regulator, regulatory protein PadR [Gaiellales bacterium]
MLGGDPIRGHVEAMVLGALRNGPTHGYGLIVRLRDLSRGAFDLKEGTVYPALHRLESDGKLESTWSVEGGRRRRVYALTPAGERALSSEREAWKAFAIGMSGVLGSAS